jgi:polar amino acid transport system substrate-binding protein
MVQINRRSAIASAFLAALTFALPAQALEKTYTIGTEGAYPPFNMIDASGKIGGFDVEIGLALCTEMKVTCDVVAQDWDGIIPGLVADKYDMIIASMFITEERKQKVAFTDPYYKAAMTHVAKKGAGITDLSDAGLKGKVIGVQAGTTQATFAEKSYPSAEIKSYPTQDEVNLDMAAGRLDLQVGDMIPMLDWVKKTKDGNDFELIGEPITDPAFVGDGVGIAVRQSDNELREAINTALKAIIANGTYEAINNRYFAIDIYTMK